MLSDTDLMPIGKEHRGKRMIDVPDSWFKWFYSVVKNKPVDQLDPKSHDVLMYIEDSFVTENW